MLSLIATPEAQRHSISATRTDYLRRPEKTETCMNLEKVIFAFCIILALSLNFSFFIGELSKPVDHQVYVLFAALVVSLICTVMKFGDRTHFGSTVLASSLVVDLLLIAAAITWGAATFSHGGINSTTMVTVSSLAGGALIANLLSVILLIIETSQIRK